MLLVNHVKKRDDARFHKNERSSAIRPCANSSSYKRHSQHAGPAHRVAMSSLRRRILGDSSSEPSREASPDPRSNTVVQLPARQFEKLTKTKSSKRRNAWIFGLGGLFGIAVAAFFAGNQDMIDLASLTDVGLDSIMEVLPAGLVKDAQDLQVRRARSHPSAAS